MEERSSAADFEGKVYSRQPHLALACAAVAFGLLYIVFIVAYILLDLAITETSQSFFRTAFLVSGMFIVFGSLGYAIREFLQPIRVAVGGYGLRIEWALGRKVIPWDQIASLTHKETTQLFPLTAKGRKPQPHLVLKDSNGRKIAQISDSLDDFADCVADIEARSSQARGVPTFDRERHNEEELRKRRRKRVTNVVLGAFLLGMGLCIGILLTMENLANKRLRNEGVVVPATVTDLSTYHTAKRINYTYKDPKGMEHNKRTGIARSVWSTLAVGDTIEVLVDPLDGATCELVKGAIKQDAFPLPLILLMSVVIASLGLLCLLMPFFGIHDIKIADGKIRLMRINDPLETPQPSAPTPAPAPAAPPTAPPVPGVSSQVVAPPSIALSKPLYERPVAQAATASLPKGLLVIVVLNVIFGLGGMAFNGLRGLVCYLISEAGDTVTLGEAQMQLDMPLIYPLITYAGHFVGVALASMLLVSALGIYRLRRWGIVLASLGASGQILMRLLGLANVILGPRWSGADEETGALFALMKVFLCFLIVVGMVYPTILLIVLNRSGTKTLFPKGDSYTGPIGPDAP